MEPWFAALARPTAAVPSAAAHNNALAWRTSRAGAVCERASPCSSTRCPPVISKAPAAATIPPTLRQIWGVPFFLFAVKSSDLPSGMAKPDCGSRGEGKGTGAAARMTTMLFDPRCTRRVDRTVGGCALTASAPDVRQGERLCIVRPGQSTSSSRCRSRGGTPTGGGGGGRRRSRSHACT
jgi:hypothetical protein